MTKRVIQRHQVLAFFLRTEFRRPTFRLEVNNFPSRGVTRALESV